MTSSVSYSLGSRLNEEFLMEAKGPVVVTLACHALSVKIPRFFVAYFELKFRMFHLRPILLSNRLVTLEMWTLYLDGSCPSVTQSLEKYGFEHNS